LKRVKIDVVERRRYRFQHPDPTEFSTWLLCAYTERPCSRAAERQDERAAFHSFTSSARAMSG
jgi:hypothetical protein